MRESYGKLNDGGLCHVLVLLNSIQAYFRDAVELAPDKCNKANISINQVTQTLWFPIAYISYIYTILYYIKCAIVVSLKNAHTLILKFYC